MPDASRDILGSTLALAFAGIHIFWDFAYQIREGLLAEI
jgi:hypothetical protein